MIRVKREMEMKKLIFKICKAIMKMFGNDVFAIITDCCDENARGRLTVRLQAFFGNTPAIVGVNNELEAALNLVDVLDAALGADANVEGVVLVNVAPRYGNDWENGVPFCFFYVGKILVVSTVGKVLSLAKKFGLVSSVNLLDIPTVMLWALEKDLITNEQAEEAIETQFRSLEFVPMVAKWIKYGKKVPSVNESGYEYLPDMPAGIVLLNDKFGNQKLSCTFEEMEREIGKGRVFRFDKERIFPRLNNAPCDGFLSIIERGSSGFGENRLAEIDINGGNAAEKSKLRIGDSIFK